MTVIIALLLLLLKSSCGYVPFHRVSFTLGDSKRTILLPSVLDHSQQRSQQCSGLTLAATIDPVVPLPLASASELERKLMELERKLEKSEMERKLEKVEMERKLLEMERKLEKAEVERKQGRKSIISSSFIDSPWFYLSCLLLSHVDITYYSCMVMLEWYIYIYLFVRNCGLPLLILCTGEYVANRVNVHFCLLDLIRLVKCSVTSLMLVQ